MKTVLQKEIEYFKESKSKTKNKHDLAILDAMIERFTELLQGERKQIEDACLDGANKFMDCYGDFSYDDMVAYCKQYFETTFNSTPKL